MNEEYLKHAAYIHTSKYRERIMKYLQKQEYATPTDIAKNTGINGSHTSTTLVELDNMGFVECLNKEARKGRLYKLTSLGMDVVEHLDLLKT